MPTAAPATADATPRPPRSQQVGAALLRRGHRGSELSKAGAILMRGVRSGLQEIDGAVREVRRQARAPVVHLFTD